MAISLALGLAVSFALPPGTAAAISLAQCLELAHRNAPVLQQSDAEVSRAEEAIQVARAAMWPSLRLDASVVQVNEAPKTVFDIPGSPFGQQAIKIGSANAVTVKAEAGYTVYSGGRTPALGRAATADAKQEASARDQTGAELVRRVSKAYYRELSAGLLQAAAAEALTTAQSHLRVAHARVLAGTAPKLEELRSQEDVALRQIAVVRVIEAKRMARVELETAIGTALAPGDSLQAPAPPSAIEPDSTQAIAAAFVARPEIASLQRQIEATTERVQATRAEHRPKVDLTGKVEYRGPNRGETYFEFSEEGLKTYDFSAGVFVTMPVLDGGSIDGRTGELRAARTALEASQRDLALRIRRDVQQALSDLRVAIAVWSSNETRISSAREAVRLAEAAYKEGTANDTDVRDAASALTRVLADQAESLRDYWFARTELDHATGADVVRREN